VAESPVGTPEEIPDRSRAAAVTPVKSPVVVEIPVSRNLAAAVTPDRNRVAAADYGLSPILLSRAKCPALFL